MQDDRYENRKEYIKKIRESFDQEDKSVQSGFRESCHSEEESDASCSRSFWKLRLLAAVLCFIAFFMMRQTGWHNQWISDERIVSQIRKNYDMDMLRENLEQFTSFLNKDR